MASLRDKAPEVSEISGNDLQSACDGKLLLDSMMAWNSHGPFKAASAGGVLVILEAFLI